MRLIYIIITFAIIFSCNEKDKVNINTTFKKKIANNSNKVIKEIPEITADFILNEKNSMDFFLEYDKIHKENVVELFKVVIVTIEKFLKKEKKLESTSYQ